MRSTKKLRTRLKQKKIIRSLGAHDVLSALVAEQAGFEMIFIGGFGATASLLGQPDLNLLTLNEMTQAVTRMARRLRVPLVTDGDTGHGGVHNVARTVREFEAGGAAGMILEDQVAPKRCGHFFGKDVIPMQEMGAKIRAAKAAQQDRDFVLIARTDARDTHGINEAIKRVRYYSKCGADMVFIESPNTLKEIKAIPKKVKTPLLFNMLTGGKTPPVNIPEIEKLGYKIAVYPIESLLIMVPALRRLAKSILKTGSVEAIQSEMIPFSEIKDILGLLKRV